MKICTLCNKPIPDKELFTHADGASLHGTCAEVYTTSGDVSEPDQAGTVGELKCQQCGGEMKKTKKVERSMGLQLVGVLLFFVGVVLCFFVPPIGVIAGVIVMIIAARLGYSQKKVWKCGNCGYFFERD